MKTLILPIILLLIPSWGYGQKTSLFDEIVGGEEINTDLAQKFISEGKIIVLYLEDFGFSPNEYKSLLDLKNLGNEVQIVFVPEEKGIRYVTTQKYNRVVWKHIQKHTQIRNNFIAFGFGCQGYEMVWVDKWMGEWTFVFNRTHIFPLIKFSKDTLSLHEYSQCVIEEYYVPLLNLQADGKWKLTIFHELIRVKNPRMKLEQAWNLYDFLISKGISPDQLEVKAATRPTCATLYYPPQDLMGLNIELIK